MKINQFSNKYKVLPSLSESESEGWVWISSPKEFRRTTGRITHSLDNRSVLCEVRSIDENFAHRYNKSDWTIKFKKEDAVAVINLWYREKLAVDKHKEYELSITISESSWFKIRACIGHPNIVVRVATWLGIASIGLGFLSMLIALISFKN